MQNVDEGGQSPGQQVDSAKSTQASNGVPVSSHTSELCPEAWVPYSPPSGPVPGPAWMSPHESHFPVRVSTKLEFSCMGHVISDPRHLHVSRS